MFVISGFVSLTVGVGCELIVLLLGLINVDLNVNHSDRQLSPAWKHCWGLDALERLPLISVV